MGKDLFHKDNVKRLLLKAIKVFDLSSGFLGKSHIPKEEINAALSTFSKSNLSLDMNLNNLQFILRTKLISTFAANFAHPKSF